MSAVKGIAAKATDLCRVAAVLQGWAAVKYGGKIDYEAWAADSGNIVKSATLRDRMRNPGGLTLIEILSLAAPLKIPEGILHDAMP